MNTKNIRLAFCLFFALAFILTGCTVGKQVSSAVGSLTNRIKLMGDSMEPTIKNEQVITCSAVQPSDLQRGDIICFSTQGSKAVKRLIGLPNETVEIRDGAVYINDQVVSEPYISNPAPETTQKVTLSGDDYYVLGDNRSHSMDSRSFGPVKAGDILGKVVLAP